MKDIPQGKFGWICPICGTVYSPEVKTCSQCNKQVATNTESMISEIGAAARVVYPINNKNQYE